MGPAEPAIPFRFRSLTESILGCAIEVHRGLGPGLLESTYVACLAHEFARCNIEYAREVSVDIEYKGLTVSNAYRADFVIANEVVLEIRDIPPVHAEQH